MANKPQQKTKAQAVRTCIACGKKFPKHEMIRFVRTPSGQVEVDLTGKKSGRGANLTMDPEHFELAVKKRAFKRALKLDEALSEDDIERLRKEFLEAIEQRNFRKGRERVTVKVSKQDYEQATS